MFSFAAIFRNTPLRGKAADAGIVYAGRPEYGSVVLFNPIINCAAIVALTVVCLIIGTFFFAGAEKNK